MSKYLIITGASRGIGAATAKKFAAEDWQVINISRNALDQPAVKNIVADLADYQCVEKIIQELRPLLSQATQVCLVHNAAGHTSDTVQTINALELEELLAICIITPTQLNKHLISSMPKSSSIIYIGSTLSEKAVAGAASYITAKHAVVGLMRASCQDLAGTDIHTCCICPGFTDTEMMRGHINRDPMIADSIKARVGANRLIEPREIAELVWFCSQNPVINGSVIHAHLGQIEK